MEKNAAVEQNVMAKTYLEINKIKCLNFIKP